MNPETHPGGPTPEETIEPTVVNGCANCGSPDIVSGYKTNLCAECRTSFIKFPIPLWIKLFAGGILVILIISLINFPANFSLGMHLERGKKAEKSKRFLTAQREFASVTRKAPENHDAWAHLMKTAFYNLDFATFDTAATKLDGVDFEDGGLIGELNYLVDQYIKYSRSDSFRLFVTEHSPDTTTFEPSDSLFRLYLANSPYDEYALIHYANFLHDQENFEACDSILNVLLEIDRMHLPAMYLQAGVKRRLEQWQASIDLCDRILGINAESPYAISSKARVYLKQKKDKEALGLVLQAIKIDKDEPFSIATLALVYHFNDKIAERDKIIRSVETSGDSSKLEYLQYAKDVIEQKEKFR